MSASSTQVALFSYGTLQQSNVQLALFGRLLEGRSDSLPGYALGTVEIADPSAVATSGLAIHKIVRPSADPAAIVAGTVLMLTPAELDKADSYEDAAYRRVQAVLASGIRAFVFVATDT